MIKQNQAVKNGLFLGIILLLFSLILSYTNARMYLQLRSSFLAVPFVIILIKNAFDERRLNLGSISFGKLFISGFICSFVAILICSTFEYILFNYLYPDLIEIYRNVSLESLEMSKEIYNDKLLELSKNELLNNNKLYGIGQVFLFFIIRLIMPGALLSAMVALMFKKSKSTSES